MGKLSKLFSVSLLCFSLIIAAFDGNQRVSAQSNEDLVPPLVGEFLQNEDEVNIHLKKMGFTEPEVASFSIEMKQDIASKGGIKKEAVKSDSKVVHNRSLL